MRWIIICFFALLLICVIFVVPFKIKLNVHVNFNEGKCYYLIYLWFITFICGTIKIENNKLIIKNFINHITGNGGEKYKLAIYKEYLKRLGVCYIVFYKRFGDDGDAKKTSVVCALENIFICQFENYIRQKNKISKLECLVFPNFTSCENNTTVYAVLKISPLSVIISIIKAKLNKD